MPQVVVLALLHHLFRTEPLCEAVASIFLVLLFLFLVQLLEVLLLRMVITSRRAAAALVSSPGKAVRVFVHVHAGSARRAAAVATALEHWKKKEAGNLFYNGSFEPLSERWCIRV